MIFQDALSSLNPVFTVGNQLTEAIRAHLPLTRGEARKRAVSLLEKVGLPDAEAIFKTYPHTLSGGQRQRIAIARALSLNPRLIVCDEPVSALDVSIQAQILNLFRQLQRELGLTYLFIGHGLGAVNYVSDRIAVMYLGQIVEIAKAGELFRRPAHPYTRALCDAVPVSDPDEREDSGITLSGEAGSHIRVEDGCRFRPRCPFACGACAHDTGELLPLEQGSSHLTACRRSLKEGK